tara:strand:+ start:565 stop:942 length:378 start_codon:yes stop_codon:yes gene_type:complete
MGTTSMKISKRQLRRIIREAIEQDETITMRPGDSFETQPSSVGRKQQTSKRGYKTTITLSPTGDSLLVSGGEAELDFVPSALYIASGQKVPDAIGDAVIDKIEKQMASGYVEVPISWSQSTGWKF